MRQPHVAQQSIIPLLVENQLAVSSQARVDFAVTVEIGRKVPRAIVVVEVEHRAFADVDEQSDILAASITVG